MYECSITLLVSLELGGLRIYTNSIIVDQKITSADQPVNKAI